MKSQFKSVLILILCLACILVPGVFAQSGGNAVLNRLAIRGSEQGIEIEATATQPITTESQVLTGPDRLVVDFPGVVPGAQVRNLRVNQGGIKGVRVGLFQSNPPITRVVLDLTAASPYQLVPNGNSVVVKLGQSSAAVAARPSPVSAQPKTAPAVARSFPALNTASVKVERWPVNRASVVTAPPGQKNIQVSFRDGLLSIAADKASLADVLYEIHLRTGADIPIPAGAEREKVIVKTGPAPANQAMATLLNGTSFNFVLVGSEQDPKALRSVILSPRGSEGVSQPIAQPMPQEPVAEVPPPIDIPPPPPDVPENVPDTPQVEEPPALAPGQVAPGQIAPGQAVPQLAAPTAPPAPPMQPDPNAAPTPPEPPPN